MPGEETAARTINSCISFGYETNDYSTTTASFLRESETVVRDSDATDLRAQINPDTFKVHWKLGVEPTNYETTNRMPDLTGFKKTALSTAMLKGTNFELGNDTVDYDWKRQTARSVIDEATMRQCKKLEGGGAKPQGPGNIMLGIDTIKYESECVSQFGAVPMANRTAEKTRIKAFVGKLKESAYVPGYEKTSYERSNFMPTHANRKAKIVKGPAVRSSICLGSDTPQYKVASKFFH